MQNVTGFYKNNLQLLKALLIIALSIMLYLIIDLLGSNPTTSPYLQRFSITFISIILEAIPFVLIGSIVASIIQVFVSEQLIAKIIPDNKLIALLMASMMGFIFPVCECAIIPIMRKLIKKGVPSYIAITFMLSVLIIFVNYFSSFHLAHLYYIII